MRCRGDHISQPLVVLGGPLTAQLFAVKRLYTYILEVIPGDSSNFDDDIELPPQKL